MKNKMTVKMEVVGDLSMVVRVGDWIVTPNIDGGISVTLPGREIKVKILNQKNTVWMKAA